MPDQTIGAAGTAAERFFFFLSIAHRLLRLLRHSGAVPVPHQIPRGCNPTTCAPGIAAQNDSNEVTLAPAPGAQKIGVSVAIRPDCNVTNGEYAGARPLLMDADSRIPTDISRASSAAYRVIISRWSPITLRTRTLLPSSEDQPLVGSLPASLAE